MASQVEKPLVDAPVEEVDSEDEEEGSDEGSGSNLQLGFLEDGEDDDEDEKGPMFSDTVDWTSWDGGRCGGKPFWLDPVDLPSPDALACSCCKEPLTFLLQIYCPLDEPFTGAYHRMLYLFCCRKGSCLANGGIIALRSQLANANPFYSPNPKKAPSPSVQAARLCAVCGAKGPLLCVACRGEAYCSKSHQKAAWKSHKAACKAGAAAAGEKSKEQRHKCVLPCFDISVNSADEVREEADAALVPGATEAMGGESAGGESAGGEGTGEGPGEGAGEGAASADREAERAEMASMRQKDIVGRGDVDSSAMRDPVTFKFYCETAYARSQVGLSAMTSPLLRVVVRAATGLNWDRPLRC